MVVRRGIGFEILRVQLGTVELLVYLLETIKKTREMDIFVGFSVIYTFCIANYM